jgi:hypothetical protein
MSSSLVMIDISMLLVAEFQASFSEVLFVFWSDNRTPEKYRDRHTSFHKQRLIY